MEPNAAGASTGALPAGGAESPSTAPSAPVGAPAPTGAPAVQSFLEELLGHLAQRATWLRGWNIGLLGLTIIVLATCIVMFWRSDAIVDHLGRLKDTKDKNAQQREELAKQRTALGETLSDSDRRLAVVDTKLMALRSARDTLGSTKELTDQYRAPAALEAPAALAGVAARVVAVLKNAETINQARRVSQAAAAPAAEGVVIDHDNRKLTVSSEILGQMRVELAKYGGFDCAAFAKDVDVIVGLLKAVRDAAQANRAEAARQKLGELETLVTRYNADLGRAVEVYEEEKRRHDNSAHAARVTNIKSELDRLDTQIAELDKNIAELQRKEFETVNAYGAWVPSLAVRVCCVILALFLTQFFMSIFRYNTMIAAHLDSRADVLRMLLRRGADVALDADAFCKLVASVSLEKVDFVLPDSVIDKIAQVAAAKIKG